MGALSQRPSRTTTYEWVTLAELQTTPVRDGAAYWNRLRGERPFPSRAEVTARDLAPLLPYVALIKVLDGGTDFENRIVGDVMVRAFNMPLQNRRLSEISKEAPEFGRVCWAPFRRVLETREPTAWRSHTGNDNTWVVISDAEVALLPLGDAPDQVDHMISFGTHITRVAR
jgi:hypothetical protein